MSSSSSSSRVYAKVVVSNQELMRAEGLKEHPCYQLLARNFQIWHTERNPDAYTVIVSESMVVLSI